MGSTELLLQLISKMLKPLVSVTSEMLNYIFNRLETSVKYLMSTLFFIVVISIIAHILALFIYEHLFACFIITVSYVVIQYFMPHTEIIIEGFYFLTNIMTYFLMPNQQIIETKTREIKELNTRLETAQTMKDYYRKEVTAAEAREYNHKKEIIAAEARGYVKGYNCAYDEMEEYKKENENENENEKIKEKYKSYSEGFVAAMKQNGREINEKVKKEVKWQNLVNNVKKS